MLLTWSVTVGLQSKTDRTCLFAERTVCSGLFHRPADRSPRGPPAVGDGHAELSAVPVVSGLCCLGKFKDGKDWPEEVPSILS